jgi:putative oxidoreductase
VNVALLVLRLVPGLLFIGHGLQKLLPPRLAPKFLAANGPSQTGSFFELTGMRPGLPLAVLAGLGEVGGGFLIASGLVTPLGTALLAAVMTVAILTVHLPKGIWNAAGGFEFPLVLLTVVYAVSALGPGSLSIDSWAGIGNWTGVHWAAQDAVRAGAAIGAGAAAGLLSLAVGFADRYIRRERGTVSPAH